MASSLRLIASSLVTRSFPPTVVSASRFLTIDRSYSTTPKDDFNGPSLLRVKYPEISSMSFDMRMFYDDRTLSLKIPDDGLNIDLDIKSGLKVKDMRACTEHNTWFIQDINQSPNHNEDESKTTNIILNNMANDIIASFLDIDSKRSWFYNDMFSDRSLLGMGLCRIIAMRSPMTSFTICKELTATRLGIEMSMPGECEMKLTTRGLRVSLRMRRIQRENVKTYFDYNTFFIEGKTKMKHHITGIHLPEGFHMRHNLIKKVMVGDVFCAFLPCNGKKEELFEQLKVGS